MTNNQFANKFLTLSQQRSPFCLGIDPTKDLLIQWGLEDNIAGLQHMCRIIVEAADGNLAIVKPQAAYFERFGIEGMQVMKHLVEEFHAQGSLVLMDVKRGDIGSTSLAYAESYLGPTSPYQGDAMTALAYMGFGALQPMIDHAANVGAGIFIIVRSSNPEGAILQNAVIKEKHLAVADYLAEEITAYNCNHLTDGVGPVGAVMGATLTEATATAARLSNALLLCPGIGYQGATMQNVVSQYSAAKGRIIPTSSRGVLKQGPDVFSLREAIVKHCNESHICLNT